MIKRSKYLNTLINTLNKDYVKLLIGVRRSGKSTLLKMLEEYLLNKGVDKKNILSINYELLQFEPLKDGHQLHEYIKTKISSNEKYYLFLDEVQEVNEWAKVVNSLRVSFNIDIYATGSNARLFLGEHLTYLSGRYMSIYVYPLSYDEFIDFTHNQASYEEHYQSFLESSFPSIVLENNPEIKSMLKQDVFETIFQRDIIMRGKVQNENLFFQVVRFVLEHIGQSISIKKISDTLNSNGVKVSYDTIDQYVSLMVKSYFLYKCERYDIKGKEILKTNGKFYVVDFGIRDQLVPDKTSNRGRILENFVYLELVKKGYKVYTGKIGRDYEIDFVAIKDDKTSYIQVTESIIDPETRARETRPFEYIDNKHKRILVSLDTFKYGTDKYDHLYLFEFIKDL